MVQRNILLIIGGGIAAYKALDLIRRLSDRGMRVRTILTEAGAKFVTPLTVAALSGGRVYTDMFDLSQDAHINHIQLSRDSDLVIVAPATADLMAKMANGLAGDLASAVLLASDKKILLAPTMNIKMWQHPATQRNVATLKSDGVEFIGPNGGYLACGETGAGRMSEPTEIVEAAEALLSPAVKLLAGRKALVTAGPTHEAIDPVRYIANRSSGKQGFAIAAALAKAGAKVTLISGPVTLPTPAGVTRVDVETAREMETASMAALPADIAVCAAAVADFRPARPAGQKIKKNGAPPEALPLTENPDILHEISNAGAKRPALVIGFAAETEHLIANAQKKLARKGCNWVVANDVSAGFGADTNHISLVTGTGVEDWPQMAKTEIGEQLVRRIAAYFQEKSV